MIAHVWQSTLFAAAAGLLTLLLKKNRARTRYWVWLAGLLKFLVPFGVLVSLGGHVSLPRWTPKATAIVEPAISFVMGGDVGEPALKNTAAAPQSTTDYLPAILFGIWACGFATILFCWVRRWMRVRADVRAASPLPIEIGIPVVSSPMLREPGVFGIFHPLLMLPEGMAQHLTKAEWDAILAHELCHVRCYDNLTAVIYMIVESIFWFHPLVWWMGTRLVAERERACDEEVLRLGSDPKIYAEGILKVCELYLESPLDCVAGVTGSNLRRRIRAIMTHQGTTQMNMTKKLVLAVAGASAVALPIVVGVLHAQTASAPKWEVISVRPSPAPVDDAHCAGGGASPGRLTIPCNTLAALIDTAYFLFADGRRKQAAPPAQFNPVSGGPAWIHSDHWQINAKAEGDSSQEMMRGPMLQARLEDRFKLKVHRETREVPVYALTAAKGGPKLEKFTGSCTPVDPARLPEPLAPGKEYCRSPLPQRNGQNVILGFVAMSLDQLSKRLNTMMDRPIVDKTGITGLFDFHLEFAPDETMPNVRLGPSDEPAGPSIFTAIQEQLGLKLEPAKGPGEFLVIDSVERPTEN